MSNKDYFCPNCKSILNPVELVPEQKDDKKVARKGLYMRCDVCNFLRPSTGFSTTHFTKRSQKDGKTLNMNPARIADIMYDKTYQVTKNITCVNKECPSRKKGKNPEIVLITSDKHPELGYLCTECKYTWGKL